MVYIYLQICTVWRILKIMYGEEYLQKSGHYLGLRNGEDTISHNNAALGVLNLGSVDYSTDNEQRSKGEKTAFSD